jgi:hypothetical protein
LFGFSFGRQKPPRRKGKTKFNYHIITSQQNANEYKRDDIFLKELNLALINGFEYYLKTERGCSTNTIWMYLIGVKHIVTIARNSGHLVINPFAGYLVSHIGRQFYNAVEKHYRRIQDIT